MKKFLVAIDFSEGSLAALAHARALGSVELVHVARTSWGARRSAGRLAELADGDPHEVRTGPLVDELLAATSASGADVLVLGARSSSATARELVRRSRVPVLFARRALASRVVVAVDFASASRDALAHGFEIAERLALPLDLLHITERADAGTAEAVRSLAKLSLERADLGAARVVVRDGPVVASLLEAIGPTDLAVCGTNGRSRVAELAYGGGVARKLVARARGSVLVVGPSVTAHRAPRPTALRAIRSQYARSPAGCETALYAECARRGELTPLEECMACGSFAGLIGQANGTRVVRCREDACPGSRSRVIDALGGLVTVDADVPAVRAAQTLRECDADVAAVVVASGRATGVITRCEAERGGARPVGALASPASRAVSENATVREAASMIEEVAAAALPVLAARSGRVLGAVSAERLRRLLAAGT